MEDRCNPRSQHPLTTTAANMNQGGEGRKPVRAAGLLHLSTFRLLYEGGIGVGGGGGSRRQTMIQKDNKLIA